MTEEPSKPKTWAQIASTKKPAAEKPVQAPVPQAPKPQASKPQAPKPQAPKAHAPVQRKKQKKPTQEKFNKSEKQEPARPKYSDEQQIFVGKIPHNVTEADLKEFFEKGT